MKRIMIKDVVVGDFISLDENGAGKEVVKIRETLFGQARSLECEGGEMHWMIGDFQIWRRHKLEDLTNEPFAFSLADALEVDGLKLLPSDEPDDIGVDPKDVKLRNALDWVKGNGNGETFSYKYLLMAQMLEDMDEEGWDEA